MAAGRRSEEGRRRHHRGDRDQGSRHRGEDRRRRSDRLHQALGAGPRPQRPAFRPLPGRPEGRCPRRPVRPPRPKVQLSIKALEVAEEKEAIAQYGSSDSGATLGDILGSALKRKGEEADDRRRQGVGAGHRRHAIWTPGPQARGFIFFGRHCGAEPYPPSFRATRNDAETCYNPFRINFEEITPCRSMPISSSIAAGCGAS